MDATDANAEIMADRTLALKSSALLKAWAKLAKRGKMAEKEKRLVWN